MQSSFSLGGKIVLVTGASRGIGYGIASEMIRMGARVAITGREDESLAKAAAALGESCFPMVSDVTRKEEHGALVERIERTMGPLAVLVNNAGIHCKTPTMDCGDAAFAEVMDVNLGSVFSLTKAALPGMLDRRSGSVINISSMAALFGLPQVAAYSSSKTALLGLTRTLAVEYSGQGVRFNCIAPGFIESRMFRSIMDADPARERKILGRTPMGRTGRAEEIGHAAVFLASDASAFITGVCLPVDGGASIGF